MKLKPHELSLVKYKCLITLISLLEFNDPQSNILNTIQRNVPIAILTRELITVYELFMKVYKNESNYTKDCFNHHEKIKEYKPSKSEYYELIIENGFNLFILINMFLDSKKKDTAEDEELNEFRREFSEGKGPKLLNEGVFGEVTQLTKSLAKSVFSVVKVFKKKVLDEKILNKFMDKEEQAELEREREKKKIMKKAFKFFKQRTVHIEILREKKLQKIYFPLLPECRFLSDEYK
mmetsp:Transcript_38694/g.34399  ORF Transcript_38694/g.34399 Transcript_38694/m.34399 type:complete len:235 (-) Transcript_38694:1403-2107(-)